MQQQQVQQNNASAPQPKEDNKNNPTGVIVLGVHIHCEGCGNEVLKYLRGYEGVELVELDVKNHKVTVKGKKANPTQVAERLRKKSGKHVELISPKPKNEEKKVEKKPTEPAIVEVVLKMYLHCEGCAKEVKSCIHKMQGVHTVDPDMAKNEVKVKGTFDSKKLIEFINKRSGRNAEIVKQSGKKAETVKQTDTTTKRKEEAASKNYTDRLELVYAPQLFSDENPNGCSVM